MSSNWREPPPSLSRSLTWRAKRCWSQRRFEAQANQAAASRAATVRLSAHAVPLYVGEPSRRSRIGKGDVARFAKAVYEECRASHGVMLAWNFSPDACKAGNVRGYRPDFLLERIDGAKELHEVKSGQFINNPNTIRKHEAAKNWCRKRGMRFVVITK